MFQQNVPVIILFLQQNETPTSEDIIDVTTDNPVEKMNTVTSSVTSSNHVAMETNAQEQGSSLQNDSLIEEALMKKGKYLFQHLKNLDPVSGEVSSPGQNSFRK